MAVKTKIVKVDPLHPEEKYLREAADILRAGGLVIIPTETVYGIAANMLNNKALARLYEIKSRPKDKPFSLHLADKEKIEEFAKDISVPAYKLIDKFLPGPLTLILKARDGVSIGIRVPDDEIASGVIRRAGVPVSCPSANISNMPAPINFEQAIKDLNGSVDYAIDAGSTKVGIESTIVDLTLLKPRVLREGAIKNEEIFAAIEKKIVLFVCTGNSCRSVMAKALLEKMLHEKKRDDVRVLSAGIMMVGGLGATEQTKEVLAQEGIDVSGHVSQRVTKSMIMKSDMILVMERLQEQKILEIAPQAKNRVFLLKEFARISDNELDVVDPIGRSLEFYQETIGIIKQAVEKIVEII